MEEIRTSTWPASNHSSYVGLAICTPILVLLVFLIFRIFKLSQAARLVSPGGDPQAYATGFAHAWQLRLFGYAHPTDPAENTSTTLARARPGMLVVAVTLGLAMLGFAGFFTYQAIRDYHSEFSQPYRGWRVPALNIWLALYAAIACFELLRAARKLGPDQDRLPEVLEHHRRFWKHFTLANFFLAVELILNLAYSARNFCG